VSLKLSPQLKEIIYLCYGDGSSITIILDLLSSIIEDKLVIG